jgi:peptide/nickel transport system permease protein
LLVHIVPGDPARTLAGGQYATPERVQLVRHQLGLDQPMVVQYGRWLSKAIRLDFGTSLSTGRPVLTELAEGLPVTADLVAGAALFAVIVALPAGIAAAVRQRRWLDKAIVAGVSLGMAVPTFWLALILVSVFAVQLKLLPAIGFVHFTDSPFQWARHLLLPWISISVVMAASLIRQLRASLCDVLEDDYIRTARSKGLTPARVVGKHALKNAAMPAITVLGLQIGYLFGGAVIVEQIFSIPGVGSLLIQAVINKDIPMLQGGVVVLALLVLATNFVVDVVYGYVNPKVRVA